MAVNGGGGRSRNDRVGPLDGLRAIAVMAVITFHALTQWTPGGFFGVDIFFVLSGYLITSLLIAERDKTGTLSLRKFWIRRARRLLPALFFMLAAVGIVATLFPNVLGSADLLGDTVATVFFVANWHLLAEKVSYFATVGHPSPLLHTWTLAIEEQFYLVWPIVLFFVLKARRLGQADEGPGQADEGPGQAEEGPSPRWTSPAMRRRRLGVVLALASLGALGSATLMAVVTPLGTVSNRAYYGTDTRAQGLLVGAALAAAVALWGPATRKGSTRALSVAGVAGLLGLVAMCRLVSETSDFAFHGGFLTLALSAAAVVACVGALPRHPVSLVLGWTPIRYIGRISYGMYLWYWPVLLVLTGARTGLSELALFVLRVSVIVVLAAISHHLIETPVLRGRLAGWRSWVLTPVAAAVVSLIPVVGASAAVTPALGVVPLPAHQNASAPLSGPPTRILVVGDSMAGSLAVGLSAVASQYGAVVINEGMPGCSLGLDQEDQVLWYTLPPGKPCVEGDPDALLAEMGHWVDQYDPDVVIYLARSDTLNIERDGTWEHVGEPAFDAWLEQRFESAISVLGSRGAKVVLLTTPYYASGEQGDGQPWPENTPARVVDLNKVLTEAATSDSGATVFDLGALLSPDATFSSVVDGVQARCADGVHITPIGGEWIGERLLPMLVTMGRAHAVVAAGSRAPVASSPPPSWYGELPCGF
jgi:peptidoglycan/LPS O-acetylase OafA/YrhL